MKYKIKSLGTGGGFVQFTPIMLPGVNSTQTTAANSSATSSNNEETIEKSSLLDEKMIEHLYKQGGLVNDVNRFVSELNQLEKNSSAFFSTSQNREITYQLIGRINEINQNKKMWEEAVQGAKQSGGFAEVAIDSTGKVFTKDEDNKIKSINLSDYIKKSKEIKLLSVAELLYERQFNPNLTGDNKIMSVASNAIGINQIITHIQKLMAALGTETKETTQTFGDDQAKQYLSQLNLQSPTKAEQEAIQVLQGAINTPGDFSEVNVKTISQRNQIDKALNYIWKTLGTQAQQKLSATAAINGVTDFKQFMIDMIVVNTDDTKFTDYKPVKDPTSESSGSSDGSSGKIALAPAELFHNDRLYQPGMFYEINNTNASVSLKMTATGIGPLFSLTKTGETIGAGVVPNIFNQNNYRAILDPGKAYIGETLIPTDSFRELAYTGEEVAKVYIPTKKDGSPDLGQMEAFNKVYQVFDANKDKWSKEESENYFRKHGFSNVQIKEINDSKGITKVLAETGNVKPFLALPIITNSASSIADLPWMVEMIGDQKDSAKLLMDEAFTIIGGTQSKPQIKNTSPSGLLSLETPYKGTMFIAYRPESSAIVSSMLGHLTGKSPTETDLYRNLNYSTAASNPMGMQASAFVLQK